MSNFFKDNLKSGIVLSIIAVLLTGIPLLGAPIGIFGFIKSKAAITEGKKLGFIGLLLSLIPIIFLLFVLFTLALTFTKR